jgi:hypothetical protein
MWDELNGFDEFDLPAPQAVPQPLQSQATHPAGSTGSLDEDEDMWDVVRDMEKETNTTNDAQHKQNTVSPARVSNAGSGDDDDWEDMYL